MAENGTSLDIDHHTGTVNAVEDPHINPEPSRRKGRKRSANGDIDHRSQQKRRLNGESSSSRDGIDGISLTRTASEEIMDRSNSNPGVDDEHPEGEDDTVDQVEANDLPNPDQIAPLTEFMYDEDGKLLSKNQQKKRRKQAEWDAKRDDRKIIRKEKTIAKRERKRAARDQAVAAAESQPAPSPKQKPNHRQRTQLPVTILIDCDFDDLMLDKERKSLASQITRSYSDTRKSQFHPHLAVCSFGGELRERFDTILTHYKGWRGIRFLDDDFISASEQAKKWMSDPSQNNKLAGSFTPHTSEDANGLNNLRDEGEIVYLTSESPYTLTALKPYSTYIVGGLVDKNREKGICYRRATERGVKTAKLPIGEFMEMSSRKVLATNHVNEIMLKWLECGDWGEAFMQVIPKRKGGKLKGDGGEEGDGEDVEDNEEDVDGVGTGVDEDGSVDTGLAVEPVMDGKGEEVENNDAAEGGVESRA